MSRLAFGLWKTGPGLAWVLKLMGTKGKCYRKFEGGGLGAGGLEEIDNMADKMADDCSSDEITTNNRSSIILVRERF